MLAEGLGSPSSDSSDVVVGFYERHRRRLYNSVAYFTPGPDAFETVHVHRKMFLPDLRRFPTKRASWSPVPRSERSTRGSVVSVF